MHAVDQLRDIKGNRALWLKGGGGSACICATSARLVEGKGVKGGLEQLEDVVIVDLDLAASLVHGLEHIHEDPIAVLHLDRPTSLDLGPAGLAAGRSMMLLSP